MRPEVEWIVHPMHELHIMSDEQWQRLRAQQSEVHRRSTAIRTAVRVENLKHVSPWYVDRPRTALKGLIGKVQW